MRRAGLAALWIGAAGSLGLMLYTGRRNSSVLLMSMFALWVLSPFAALGWAHARWRLRTAGTYGAMVLMAASCLAIYGAVALGLPRAKSAFFFLVTPPVWLLASAVVIASGIRKRGGKFLGG